MIRYASYFVGTIRMHGESMIDLKEFEAMLPYSSVTCTLEKFGIR